MNKTINLGRYQLDIYGDGNHEYEGFYMVLINNFDNQDKPISKQKRIYIKCDKTNLFENLTYNDIPKLYILPENSKVQLVTGVKIKRLSEVKRYE